MLENSNDYVSLFMIIFIIVAAVFYLIHIINLKRIESNIKKEVRYYDYDKRK